MRFLSGKFFSAASASAMLHISGSARAVIYTTAVALALIASPASAATVETEGATATSISNLDVGGTLYNVGFLVAEWPDIYGADPIYDFDEEGTLEAVAAVNAALNAEVGVTSVGSPGNGRDLGLFAIGFDESVPGITFWLGGAYSDREAGWIGDIANNPFGGSATAEGGFMMWADFTVVPPPVPVPAAVWLFGSALGLLGWMRRKAA